MGKHHSENMKQHKLNYCIAQPPLSEPNVYMKGTDIQKQLIPQVSDVPETSWLQVSSVSRFNYHCL